MTSGHLGFFGLILLVALLVAQQLREALRHDHGIFSRLQKTDAQKALAELVRALQAQRAVVAAQETPSLVELGVLPTRAETPAAK